MVFYISVTVFFLCHLGFGLCAISEQKDRIISTLFANYKSEVHPATNDDGAVVVGLTVVPLHLAVDETAAVLNSHIWLGMSWKDNRLTWDPKQYENVSTIHVGSDQLWRPDVRSFNSVTHEDYEPTEVIVHSNGRCFWIPPTTLHTSCDFDFTYWPWDVQTCYIVLGSWTKSGNEIDVININKKNVTQVQMSNYVQTIWEVKSAYATRNKRYYGGEDEPWPDVTVSLKIKRLSFVDRKIAVLPLIVVGCLTLATFWTFPLSKSRLILGSMNLIILSLMLLYLRSRLPMSGSQLPMIISFAGSLTVLVTIQLLAALAVANLVARNDSPPAFLVLPFEGVLGRVLCLSDAPLVGKVPSNLSYSIDMEAMKIARSSSSSNTNNDQPGSASSSPPAPSSSAILSRDDSGWNLLAQAVDRILFLCYFFVMVIFMGTYLGGSASQ